MWTFDGQDRIAVFDEGDIDRIFLGTPFDNIMIDMLHNIDWYLCCDIVAFRESPLPNRIKIFQNRRSFSDDIAIGMIDFYFPLGKNYGQLHPETSLRFQLLDL